MLKNDPSNDVIKIEFANKRIRLVETKDKEKEKELEIEKELEKEKEKSESKTINTKSKKITKKKFEQDEDEEDSYWSILKSSYLYNKKNNILKQINNKNNDIYDKIDNEIKYELNPNEILNSQIPIIVKNERFIDYNLNDAIEIHKSSIENFIKNNLNQDNWKYDKPNKGSFIGHIHANRRRRRGTLKTQKILEQKAKLNNK